MTAIEYLLRYKEERGISYEEMAKKTGTSPAAWHVLIKRNDPPTLARAKQLAQILEMKNPDEFINLVFKDRLVKFLEKTTADQNPLTGQIRKMIRSIKKWHPEKGEPIRYIMSTFVDALSHQHRPDLTSGNDSGINPLELCKECLTQVVRHPEFASELR